MLCVDCKADLLYKCQRKTLRTKTRKLDGAEILEGQEKSIGHTKKSHGVLSIRGRSDLACPGKHAW
jgi:hypothetical protein